MHRSRNAGNARVAGAFHGNLKAHPREPVSRRVSVCLSIGLFAQEFLFIICPFLEKQHIKIYQEDLILCCLESLTHNCAQRDYSMLRLILFLVLWREILLLRHTEYFTSIYIGDILNFKMITIEVDLICIFISV